MSRYRDRPRRCRCARWLFFREHGDDRAEPFHSPGGSGHDWAGTEMPGASASAVLIAPRFEWELVRWGWKFWRAANSRRAARAMPVLRDLGLASRQWFVEWAGLPGFDFGLVQRGLLMLCKTQRALDHEADVAATAQRLGIAADVLDRLSGGADPRYHRCDRRRAFPQLPRRYGTVIRFRRRSLLSRRYPGADRTKCFRHSRHDVWMRSDHPGEMLR